MINLPRLSVLWEIWGSCFLRLPLTSHNLAFSSLLARLQMNTSLAYPTIATQQQKLAQLYDLQFDVLPQLFGKEIILTYYANFVEPAEILNPDYTYDEIIDQINGVIHATPLATYPRMILSLQSGEVDAITAEMPVAKTVVMANPDLSIVTFDKEVESVVIDKRHIQTIRNLCKAEDTDNTVATEICLAISMLFAGAFLSAIISKVDFVFNCMAILFYIISPVTAVGCFVAYYFKRNIDMASKKQLAEHILEYLPREEGKK